jgi:hypothetical protein
MASIFIVDQETFPDIQDVGVPIRKKTELLADFHNIKLRASTKTGLKSAAAED